MNKILCLCFFAFLALAQAEQNFSEYNTRILEINDNEAKIANSELIYVGSSGIIEHSFDGEKKSILASVEVVKKDDVYAYLKVKKFDLFAQEAFPVPGIKPAVGDQVRLNYLYSRSLIVTPSEKIFSKIQSRFSSIEWVHPDILIAHLKWEYKPNPDKQDFQTMCKKNTASLIFFAIDEKGYFVDCQSFRIIKTYSIEKPKSYQVPFYNRVGKVESIFWKLSGHQIEDYTSYYKDLLGIK